MAGFRAPVFVLGLSSGARQAGFRTPLPFWNAGAFDAIPVVPDIVPRGGHSREPEEIMAVIMAFMRMEGRR